MSEEKKKEETKKEVKENSEKIKSEAKNTFNDAKESIKNVNLKNDAKVTSGYVTAIIKKPIETLKSIASDSKNTKFKNALILICVWLVVILLKSLFGVHWAFRSVGNNFLSMIKSLLGPVAGILVFSCITYFMKKDSKKKSLTTIITTITSASAPLILANVLTILTLFSAEFIKITNPIILLASVLTVVYAYFATKDLLGEKEDSTFIKKFIIIEAIYYVGYFILTFLGIYIPMI